LDVLRAGFQDMKCLLAEDNVDILAQFGGSKGVLAFDYDGTLAPITTDPSRALMSVRTRSWREKACRLYPCAVSSGRGSREISGLFWGLPIRHVLGNRGMEPGYGLDRFKAIVASARKSLDMTLGLTPTGRQVDQPSPGTVECAVENLLATTSGRDIETT
jgi:hypothetical protein